MAFTSLLQYRTAPYWPEGLFPGLGWHTTSLSVPKPTRESTRRMEDVFYSICLYFEPDSTIQEGLPQVFIAVPTCTSSGSMVVQTNGGMY